MALIPLPDSIKINKGETLDEWGIPINGTYVTLSCRYVPKSNIVQDRNGEQVNSKGYILLEGYVDVTHDDELELTTSNGKSVTEKPLDIQYKNDIDGNILFTKIGV